MAQRARDLADNLNTSDESAYRGYIKFPNAPRRSFGIPLSTVVANIKPLIDHMGVFEQYGLSELEIQTGCLVNYFAMLAGWYGKRWEDKDNAFLTAAGFTGAIDFLKTNLIPYCHKESDFTREHMESFMDLSGSPPILKEATKGMQGRTAWNEIHKLLKARVKAQGSKRQIKV